MSEAAAAYCHVIETAPSASRETFVEDAARTLAAVVAAAYRLPETEPASDDTDESADSISHAGWLAVMNDVATVLGDWDNYWTTSRVYRLDETTALPDLTELPGTDFTVNLSLADALADVWRDLRDGLNDLDRGGEPDDVIWEWRFGLHAHWGSHAVEALRALHEQIAGFRLG